MVCSSFSRRAFTLVEMAIVIAVTSLIIAAVFSAQTMRENARIGTYIADMEKLNVATVNFQNYYGGMPGDFRRATDYWGASETNGNGDGAIDIETHGSRYDEAFRVFRHLVAADMLQGTYSGTWSSAFSVGTNIMEASAGDGAVLYVGCCGTSVGTLKFRNYVNLFLAAEGATTRGALLTPTQAALIDQKRDDGLPDYGMIGASGVSCFSGAGTASVYTGQSDATALCQLYWGVDR